MIIKNATSNCAVSEYGQWFKDTQPTRGPFYKPKDLLASKGDIDLHTINNTDYVAHDVTPRKIKEPEKYVPKSGKIELVTEYDGHYLGEKAPPSKIPAYLRSVTQSIPLGKLASESVQRADFQEWKTERQKLINNSSEYMYSPPKSPFTATSIHRADFQRFNQPPRPTGRRPDQIDTSNLSMNFETTQNRDFRKYSLSVKHLKRKDEYRPPSKPFKGNSFLREDFPFHKDARKASIYKPISTVLKSESPLQSKTTSNEDFRNWPIEPLKKKDKEIYSKPQGEMDLKPTSHDYCYFGMEGIPAKSARPKTKLRTGREGQFDGTSSYSACFKSWEISPAKPIKHHDELRRSAPGTLKFTENSEHRHEYKRFNTAPARIFKPKSILFKTDNKLESKSLYSFDFDGTKGPECLSDKLLKGNISGYNFQDDPDTGHRFVIKMQSNENEPVVPKPLPPIAGTSEFMTSSPLNVNTTAVITA